MTKVQAKNVELHLKVLMRSVLDPTWRSWGGSWMIEGRQCGELKGGTESTLLNRNFKELGRSSLSTINHWRYQICQAEGKIILHQTQGKRRASIKIRHPNHLRKPQQSSVQRTQLGSRAKWISKHKSPLLLLLKGYLLPDRRACLLSFQ